MISEMINIRPQKLVSTPDREAQPTAHSDNLSHDNEHPCEPDKSQAGNDGGRAAGITTRSGNRRLLPSIKAARTRSCGVCRAPDVVLRTMGRAPHRNQRDAPAASWIPKTSVANGNHRSSESTQNLNHRIEEIGGKLVPADQECPTKAPRLRRWQSQIDALHAHPAVREEGAAHPADWDGGPKAQVHQPLPPATGGQEPAAGTALTSSQEHISRRTAMGNRTPRSVSSENSLPQGRALRFELVITEWLPNPYPVRFQRTA